MYPLIRCIHSNFQFKMHRTKNSRTAHLNLKEGHLNSRTFQRQIHFQGVFKENRKFKEFSRTLYRYEEHGLHDYSPKLITQYITQRYGAHFPAAQSPLRWRTQTWTSGTLATSCSHRHLRGERIQMFKYGYYIIDGNPKFLVIKVHSKQKSQGPTSCSRPNPRACDISGMKNP